MHICPKVMALLHEKGLNDVLVVIGGIIVSTQTFGRWGVQCDMAGGGERPAVSVWR